MGLTTQKTMACSSPFASAPDEKRHRRWSDGRSGISCPDHQSCLRSADVPCWWHQRDHLPWWIQLQGQRLLPCQQARTAVLPCWRQRWDLLPRWVQLCGCWLLQDSLNSTTHKCNHLTMRCAQWVARREVAVGWCPEARGEVLWVRSWRQRRCAAKCFSDWCLVRATVPTRQSSPHRRVRRRSPRPALLG